MLMNAFGISTKTHHAAAIDGLRMGLEVLPGAALPNALLSILPDLLPAAVAQWTKAAAETLPVMRPENIEGDHRMTQDISDEAVERFSASASYTGIMKPSRDGLWVQYHDYAALVARLKEVEEERDVQNDLRQIAEDAADEWRSRAETAEAKLAIARSFDLDALLAAAVREGVKIGAHPDYQVIANEPAAIVAAVVRVKEKRT